MCGFKFLFKFYNYYYLPPVTVTLMRFVDAKYRIHKCVNATGRLEKMARRYRGKQEN